MSTDSAAGRPRRRPPRARIFAPSLLVASALLSTACDYPTTSPKWLTEWLVPVKGTVLTVDELLPAGVTIAPDSSAFLAMVDPVTFSSSLGELCGAPCQSVSGLTAPKPAFTATLGDQLRLPADVASATLAGGTVALALTNDLSFDPLRPAATARGSIVVSLASAGATLGSLVLGGDTVALPPGATLTRDVPLTGTAVDSVIEVSLVLTSPAGDPVKILPAQRLSIVATPRNVALADVSVDVTARQVSISPFELDLSGVDPSIVDRVNGGSLVLQVANPFPITGDLELSVTSNQIEPITKPLPLTTGTTTHDVTFTQDELRSMLGRSGLSVGASGAVTAAQPVRLTPSMTVRIGTSLDLILGPKEN
jgi:hypothetical protein